MASKLKSVTIYFPNSEEHIEVGHPADNGQIISHIVVLPHQGQMHVDVSTKINGKDEFIARYVCPNVKLSYIHEEEK